MGRPFFGGLRTDSTLCSCGPPTDKTELERTELLFEQTGEVSVIPGGARDPLFARTFGTF
jgi:hypothetical protein